VGGMDAKNVAHIVAGMATMNQNSTTRVRRLEGSAEEAVAAIVAEAAAAAALSLAGRPARAPLQGSLLVELEDDWDLPGMSKAYLVEAAREEFVAEAAVTEHIDRSRCIGCRQVPF
jgi:hypothetical protein